MATTFAGAFVGTRGFATATQAFAGIVRATVMMLDRGASSLTATRVFAIGPFALAVVQAATSVLIRIAGLGDLRCPPAANHRASDQSAERRGGELMKLTTIKLCRHK